MIQHFDIKLMNHCIFFVFSPLHVYTISTKIAILLIVHEQYSYFADLIRFTNLQNIAYSYYFIVGLSF